MLGKKINGTPKRNKSVHRNEKQLSHPKKNVNRKKIEHPPADTQAISRNCFLYNEIVLISKHPNRFN